MGMLHGLGYNNITCSASCEELLNFKVQPDIIILEHLLGRNKMKGLDLIRKHRASKYPHSRFLFLSSCSDINVAISSIKAGAFDYILKSKSGLERLIKRLDKLAETCYIVNKKQKQYRAALYSLGVVGFLFILIILLYHYQLI